MSGGWIRLRCRCGLGMDSFAGQRWDSVPVQMWVGGGLGPGAEVGGYEASPVVSDKRSPKRRCGRIGVSCTKLRCAHKWHVHETPSGRKTKVHRATIVLQVCPVDEALRPPSQALGKDSVAVCGRSKPCVALKRHLQRMAWRRRGS